MAITTDFEYGPNTNAEGEKRVSVNFHEEGASGENGYWDFFELAPEDAIAAYYFLRPLIGQLHIDAFGPDYYTTLFSDLYSKEPDVMLRARRNAHAALLFDGTGWNATRIASTGWSGPNPPKDDPNPLPYQLENDETGVRVRMTRADALRLTRQLLYMLHDDQESGR